MPSEYEKGLVELSIFKAFAEKADLKVINGSARKSDPNEGKPDIFCVADNEAIYFELTEACAPEFAAATSSVSVNNTNVQNIYAGVMSPIGRHIWDN